jgi:ferredoxin
MRRPVVDIGSCTLCMGCIEVCPGVFALNAATGYIQVNDLEQFPESCVDEAIKYCPEDVISWEEE